ncbi:MAG: DNA-binding protein [Oligoflexia bacterium]|nr:DNA-binding protein [Oligoflexia bacterium]
MGAPGITKEQVFEAADKLISSGLSITVEAIRSEIGSGSYTTIMKHLEAWREQASVQSKIPNIPTAVNKHFEKIWMISYQEAERVFLQDRETLHIEKETLLEEKSGLITEIEKIETELNRAKLRIKDLEESERKLNKELNNARTQLEVTEARRKESVVMAERFENQITNLLQSGLFSAKKTEE